MAATSENQRGLESLELRIKTILPEEYQDSYEDVQPVSMGSASLKFGRDGKVSWGEIWNTFCDLAMAGGPPHKGKLLEAASREEVEAEPDRYQQVAEEICRGINLVTGVPASRSSTPGWIRVDCSDAGMAGWLGRAIIMENVSVRCDGSVLELPAGPAYRVEKEIKNVITATAKTCHYWIDHMWRAQQKVIADLFAAIELESPLIQPALMGHDFQAEADETLRVKMMENIRQETGLQPFEHPCRGWLGVKCPSVRAAIWMMRAMVVSNVFSRREDTVLFVPVSPLADPAGDRVVQILARIYGFAKTRAIV